MDPQDPQDLHHPAPITAYPLERQVEACPYLAGLQSRFEHYLFLDCDADAFCLVIESGFRHFGHYFFRPDCPGAEGRGCGACVPVRVRVADFEPSRSQRRVLRQAGEVKVAIDRPRFTAAKYDLYLEHKKRFKPVGEASAASDAGLSAEAFQKTFYADFPFTWECVYTVGERLLGMGLIDIAPRAVSSIYFSFDPAFAPLSPGTLSILHELSLARSLDVPFYYLGYMIYGNPVMRYKLDFRPCEYLDGSAWRPLREGKEFLEDPATIRTSPYDPLFEP